jgi:hypothetical protein
VPEKLLVSLRVNGHCAFSDCTEFGSASDEKLAELFGCRYQKKTSARPVTNAVAPFSRRNGTLHSFDRLV